MISIQSTKRNISLSANFLFCNTDILDNEELRLVAFIYHAGLSLDANIVIVFVDGSVEMEAEITG